MIDIHTHILPAIDDGAEDMKAALVMAQMAVNSGTEVMIATPHCNIPGTHGNYMSSELLERYEAFCEALYRNGIPLTLLLGAEVFGTFDLASKIEKGMIPTLHTSEYLLIEFDFGSEYEPVRDILESVAATGVKPVIAHPERYPFVQSNPYIMEKFLSKGYHLQVNKGSFAGQFGKNAEATALFAVNNGMASFVASDAHSVVRKSTKMAETADNLSEILPKGYVHQLLFENARKLIEGEKVPHQVKR